MPRGGTHTFESKDGLYCDKQIKRGGNTVVCGLPAQNWVHNRDLLNDRELKYVRDLIEVDAGENAPRGVRWNTLASRIAQINVDAAEYGSQ